MSMTNMPRSYVIARRDATVTGPSRQQSNSRHVPAPQPATLARAPPLYAIRNFKLKGRGLVATQDIPARAQIVTCPVIVYDDTDAGRISKTRLGDYNFRFGVRQNRACIILGVISLCNHADEPNAEIVCDEDALMVTLVATREIGMGEEICIRYRRPLWFTPAA
jgi:SET domain-containing protein